MHRHRLLLFLWLVTDLLVFCGAYCAAYFLRVGPILSTDFPFDQFLVVTVAISPLWLAVLATTRTFALTRNQRTIRNAAYIIYSCLVGTALFTLGYYFTYSAFFSRLLLLYAFAGSAIAIFVWHLLYEQVLRVMLRRNPPAFPTLIVGVTRESRALIKSLQHGRNPLKPVAILDGRGVKDIAIEGVSVLGKLDKLESTLEKFQITHLIQCSDLEQSLNLLSACRNRSITYMLLPSVLGIVERDEAVESLEGLPMTVVRPGRSKWMWFFR